MCYDPLRFILRLFDLFLVISCLSPASSDRLPNALECCCLESSPKPSGRDFTRASEPDESDESDEHYDSDDSDDSDDYDDSESSASSISIYG